MKTSDRTAQQPHLYSVHFIYFQLLHFYNQIQSNMHTTITGQVMSKTHNCLPTQTACACMNY